MAPLPTATPEPTENDSLGDYRFEINNPYDIGTVMRKKPKISGEVVCTVKNGTHVRIIGDTTNADGFTWREIQTENGLTGFVNDAHIK